MNHKEALELAALKRDDSNLAQCYLDLHKKIKILENRLFMMGAMDKPPCFCCGYNGPGYYNSEQHPCADRHHKLVNYRYKDQRSEP